MSFRTIQRDDRRRRMMTAGSDASATSVAAYRRSPTKAQDGAADDCESRGYADAALRDYQPHLMDFVPQRAWKVAASLMAVISLTAVIATLHLWLPQKLAIELQATSLDLTAAAGLGTWFGSIMLLAAAVVATVIHSIRAHKIDDYRGRYRVWRQAAIAWFVLGAAVGSNACETIEFVMASVAGGSLAGNAALWWALPAAALVGYIAPALIADLSRCRLGTAALVSAISAWSFG
ncbi:MAG: hypothetical protein MI757_07345, partial [Pirellulales bacterium]|nr:hypothetical protein [Pirellulales bacterium]